MEMAQTFKIPSSLRVSLTELGWKLIALAALTGCTALGWYLFEVVKRTGFDNEVSQLYRTVAVTLQVVFRLDPVLTVIVFPFAVVVIMILILLLVWMHKDRE